MQGMTRKQLVEIAQFSLARYGVTSQKIRFLKSHQYATMFRIKAGETDFTLRLFSADSRRLAQAQFEVDWLTALHQDTTLRVPQPQEIIQLKEGLYAVLMTFVKGHHVRKSINSSHLFKQLRSVDTGIT